MIQRVVYRIRVETSVFYDVNPCCRAHTTQSHAMKMLN